MADPITVQCPHCKVKLKLKAVPPAGKKVGCPKCKKPFPVKAPKKKDDDDFLDALDDLNEEDYDAPEDESEEQEEEAPASRSTLRSRSSVTRKGTVKGKKKGGKKSSGGPILAIIGGSVAALALVAGLVYLLMNLPGGGGAGGGGGIRSASGEFIAFLPPDAEVFVTARPADIMASPFAAPLQQNPQAKMGFAQIEQSLGFPLAEIEHVFFGVKVTPNAGNPAAGPMGGNPMMGMPGGMPGGPGGMPGAMPGGMPGGPGGMPGMGMPGGNRAPTADVVAVLRLKQPYGGKTLEQISQQSPPKTHKGVQYHVNAGPNAGAFFFADERHVVMTEPAQIEKVIDRKDQPENNSFLAYLAKDQHITLVAAPKQSGAFAKLPPGLSGMMPDQNAQKLLEDVTTVRLDVNLPGGIDLKVTLTCKSDSAAQQIHAETTKQIDQLKQQVGFLKLVVPEIDSVLNTLQVNQSGSTMSVAVSVPKTTIEQLSQRGGQAPGGVSANAGLSQNSGLPGASGAGVPGISSIGLPTGVPTTAPNGTDSADPTASLNEAANRTKAMNNLKQVLLAFHNHHDTHGSFPAAFSADAAGTPLLSWRVHILPFLEQKDLYDQFHLNEPWDSEHNKTLIARMPAVFASDDADLASQGLTRFVVPSGPGMAFEGKDPLRLRDFLDGTSLTIAAVEVARDSAVIWTKPDDLIFDPEMPLQNLEGARGEYFMAGFADGATRLIKTSIAADLLKALFTRKGMEPIPANAIP